jgi:hypothetical protein
MEKPMRDSRTYTQLGRPARAPVRRRQVLRGMLGGVAVAVGLPFFDYMLDDNGEAFADGEPLWTRFGLWYFGNGTRLNSWIPSAGPDWQPPGEGALEALATPDLKPYVSVVSGLNVMTPRHPHHSGAVTVCSGGPHYKVSDVRDTIVSTFKYPSIDQIAASYFMDQTPTPYRSLEAAVTRFRGTDEGTTFQYLSHNGSTAGEEESPHAFWDRLFNQGTAEPLIKKARASVLDAVGDQITTLKPKLGKRDQQRLEQHLSSIGDLEARLNAPVADCTKPDDPGEFPDIESNEQMAEKNVAMSDLMAVALACGLTRSFSILYSTCGSGAVYWNVGATDGQHYMNHTEASPWTKQHQAVRFTMEQFAYFLNRLRETPEGAGNLLDNCSIFACTEHAEGWTHSQDDMPMLLCGKGSGRLRGNYHHRGSGGNTTRALLTALRGAGLPLTEFGYEDGHATDPITELEG